MEVKLRIAIIVKNILCYLVNVHYIIYACVLPWYSSVYIRVPQIFPWRANLQSLAPALINLTFLWFSNDLEDSD